jgi:UDP-glucuronate 4-epimerase
MNILVTGGDGFIGSHVCEKLLERGDNVVCVDMVSDTPTEANKRKNMKVCLLNGNFKFVDQDIRDLKNLDWVFYKHKPEKIIHLAAKAGVRESIINPELYKTTNIDGTKNMLELSAKYKVKNFVFASSSSVYGTSPNIPFSETDVLTNIVSPYAETKKQGEELCRQYHVSKGLNITCLRFFTVYGPRGRPDMAPYKFVDMISKGEPIQIYLEQKEFEKGLMARDFTFISDIVDGVLLALDKDLSFEILNLGRGHPVKLNEFIRIVENALGKKAKKEFIGRQEGDVPITYADLRKAKKLLEYEPKVPLEEGIKTFVEWYNENIDA